MRINKKEKTNQSETDEGSSLKTNEKSGMPDVLMNWIKISEETPTQNGRYWVYPYVTIGGDITVGWANFIDGEFEKMYRQQHFVYWKPLSKPRPPKEEL